MPQRRPILVALAASFTLLSVSGVAQTVQVAPFGGVQFGSSPQSSAYAASYAGTFLGYGAALDLGIADDWSSEFLYARQHTAMTARDGPLDVTVERMMAGIMQETDLGASRLFGVALAGGTRFAPGFSGYSSDTFFTLGLGLGLKRLLSDHFGVRMEARGFYAITGGTSGLFCRGGCLLVFNGSGLWHADLSAGVVIAF